MVKKSNITMDYLKEEFLNLFNSSNERLFWESGWNYIHQERNTTGQKYNGINALYLSLVSSKKKYDDNRWFTVNQLNAMNKSGREKDPDASFIHVRKGEKASYVEYPYNYMVKGTLSTAEFEKKLSDANKAVGRPLRTKKGYYNNTFTFEQVKTVVASTDISNSDFWIGYKNYPVFNGSQIEGIEAPQLFNTLDINKISIAKQLVDNYVKNEGITVESVLNQSGSYNILSDSITLPPEGTFKDEEYYISTFIHEICHSTGSAGRLNRAELQDISEGTKTERTDNYCKEELNSEIAATLLCSELGVQMSREHIDNHMLYVKTWAERISGNKGEQFLRTALNNAAKIVDFVKEKGEYEKIMLEHSSLEKTAEKVQNEQVVPLSDKNPQQMEMERA